MQNFAFFAVLVCSVVLAIGLFYRAQSNARLRDDVYDRFAAARGGRFFPGGIFGKPAASFLHGGVTAIVSSLSTGPKREQQFTQIQLQWPDMSFRWEVFPEKRVYSTACQIGHAGPANR